MTDKILKIIKNKNNHVFAVILILGIILMFAAGSGESGDKKGASEEKRMEELLGNTEGVGKTKVYINYKTDNNVNGKKYISSVVILAENDNPYVKRIVSETLSTALDVPAHRIKVLKRKS